MHSFERECKYLGTETWVRQLNVRHPHLRLFPNLSIPKKSRAGTCMLSVPRLGSGSCTAQLSELTAEGCFSVELQKV